MDLREYEHLKFALAAVLQQIPSPETHERRERLRELFSRLAEDRFNLVVVGRFSRGKTSLMNAVLATDRLPTGIRPLTSVITTVAYGPKEQAVIHYLGLGIPEDIQLARLPEYITENGNSGNRRRVRVAEVQLPAEFLRRGFYFVDTPGLGSPILANTRTTEEFLPQADAFVLVTSYESPLSEEELRTLRAAASRRVFVVVNKQDMVSDAERDEALRYLREQLGGHFGETLQIFSVSARDGLEAKQRNDPQRLADSGLPRLEEALVRFLTEDKTREFLIGMCERAIGVVRELAPAGDRDRLGAQVEALAKRIIEDHRQVPPRPLAPPGVSTAVDPTPRLRPCEICGHVLDRVFEFLRHFQYDITLDPNRQQTLAEAGGLCSFHAWQYETVASPRGTCIGLPATFDHWAARLQDLVRSPLPSDVRRARLDALFPQPETCALCRVRADAEASAVSSIAAAAAPPADAGRHAVGAVPAAFPHARSRGFRPRDAEQAVGPRSGGIAAPGRGHAPLRPET